MNWNFQEILTKDPSSAWGCDTSGKFPPCGVALRRTCRCTEIHRVKTQICVTRPQCVNPRYFDVINRRTNAVPQGVTYYSVPVSLLLQNGPNNPGKCRLRKDFFACILNYFSSLILLQNLFLTLMKGTFYEFLNLPKQSRDVFVLVALLEIQQPRQRI